MSHAVAKAEPKPQVVAQEPAETNAIISMIERAARDPAVDIDKMQRLLDMRAAEASRLAKVGYAAALSAMQTELPVITKRGTIKLGNDASKNPSYALWEDINDAIKPVMAKHGFALSFRTGRDGDKIMVTGILSHKEGHSEETTMLLPIDTGPGRNAVQSIGSSTSYGKRYTAAALLNLTSRGEDDDGSSTGTISEEQVGQLRSLIVEVAADIPKFCRYMKVERIEDIRSKDFDRAVTALEGKRAKS
jgi:hypothetical protein